MTAFKQNYDDALRDVRTYAREGHEGERMTAVVEKARQAGAAYEKRTARCVNVEAEIRDFMSEGETQRRPERGIF